MRGFLKKAVVVPVDFSTASADAIKTGMTLVPKTESVRAEKIAINSAI